MKPTANTFAVLSVLIRFRDLSQAPTRNSPTAGWQDAVQPISRGPPLDRSTAKQRFRRGQHSI